MSDLIEQFKKKAERAQDAGDYERVAEQLWDQMKREGIHITREQAFHFILQLGKAQLTPIVANRKELNDDEVGKARMIKASQIWAERGEQAAEDYLDLKQKFPSGKEASLREIHGDIDKDVSSRDFLIFKKGNEAPHAAFRGSTTKLGDHPRMFTEDWGFNVRSVGGQKMIKDMESYKKMKSDFAKAVAKEKPQHVSGYSKGGNSAMDVGEEHGIAKTVMNPFASGNTILKKAKMPTHVLRTTDDWASTWLGFKKLGKNTKVDSFNSLDENVNPAAVHKLTNFTEGKFTGKPRAVVSNIIHRAHVLNKLKGMKSELDLLEKAENISKAGGSFTDFAQAQDAAARATKPLPVPKPKVSFAPEERKYSERLVDVTERNIINPRDMPLSGLRSKGVRIGRATKQVPYRDPEDFDKPRDVTMRGIIDPRDHPLSQENSERIARGMAKVRAGDPETYDPTTGQRRATFGKPKLESNPTPQESSLKAAQKRSADFLAATAPDPKDTGMGAIPPSAKEARRTADVRIAKKEEIGQPADPADVLASGKDDAAIAKRATTFQMQGATSSEEGSEFQRRMLAEGDDEASDQFHLRGRSAQLWSMVSKKNRPNKPVLTEEEAEKLGRQAGGNEPERTMHSLEHNKFLNMTDDERLAARAGLESQIAEQNAALGEMANAHASGMRGAMRNLFSSRSLLGLGGGAIAGMATEEIMDAIPALKNMNKYGKDMIEGAVAGATTESIAMKLSGEVLTAGATGAKLAEGALGAGVGLIVGDFTTQAIKNAFGKNANPYVRDITGDVVGDLAGGIAGLTVTTAVAAGALAVAGGSAAVSAADWWNPIGWGAAVVAATSAIVGGVQGAVEASHEEAEKKAALAKLALEKKEVTYSASADVLNMQYDEIKKYARSIGVDQSDLTDLDNKLKVLLTNPTVTGMTKAEFKTLLDDTIAKYHLPVQTPTGILPEEAQLQRHMTQKYVAQQTSLRSTALNLGVKNYKPPAGFMTNAEYDTEWNKLLSQNQAQATKFNLKPRTAQAETPVTGVTPAGYHADDITKYESLINQDVSRHAAGLPALPASDWGDKAPPLSAITATTQAQEAGAAIRAKAAAFRAAIQAKDAANRAKYVAAAAARASAARAASAKAAA